MNERFKELRNQLGLSRDAFANKLGLKSRGKIENIESNKIEPDEAFIKLVCKTYKVNYQWLVNGIGDMYQDDDGDAQAIIDSVMTGDNEFAKKTLVAFAKMSEEQWEVIRDLIKNIESS